MTSTRKLQSVAVVGMLVGAMNAAGAQSCMGLPSLSTISRSITTVADAYGSERAILGRAGMSTQRVFGGIQAGYVGTKVQDPDRLVVGVDAGFTLQLGKGPHALHLCPLAQGQIQLGRGPYSFDKRTTHALLGLSIGQEFRLSSRVAITPFLDGTVSRWGYNSPGFDAELSPYFNYSELGARYGAGFGLRLGEAFTVRPALHLTGGFSSISRQGNQPGATLSISYGFRRR